MIGPFCYKNLSNDEEYKNHLKKRIKIYILIIICGLVTLLCLWMSLHSLAEYAKGFLAGVGTGLIVGGIVLLFKSYRLLKNNQKIREERIKISDERNRMISDQASKIALIGLIIEMYVIAIVSLLDNSNIYRICTLFITSFLFLYIIAFRFYSRKY